MSEELKACPFCGGEAELHHQGNYRTKKRLSIIECKTFGCFGTARVGALTHDFEWMDAKVIEQWNTRTESQQIQSLTKQVEEARSLVDKQTDLIIKLDEKLLEALIQLTESLARNEELQSQLKLTSNVPYREAYQRGADSRDREVEQLKAQIKAMRETESGEKALAEPPTQDNNQNGERCMTINNINALRTIAAYMGYDRLIDFAWINPIAARMCDRFNESRGDV